MFESSPGGNIGFEPDMKIVQEYVDILGGADSPQFKAYKKACVHAYLAIKPYWREIQYLVCIREMEPPNIRKRSLKKQLI